jgi:hypothetical protein
MKLLVVFAAVGFIFVSVAANGQVIFNDNFNGSSVSTNNGVGAANPTANTTAFNVQTDSGTLTQNAGGASFNPGGGYGEENLSSVTGNTDGGFAYALGATGTDFAVTVDNINVTANSAGNRSDIPNSGNGGFRYELGIVSANNGGGDPELYSNSNGGLYVNLFYNQQGVLTGDVRATDSTKGGSYDSAGSPGIYELASFNIPQSVGTTSSYTNPLTVTFDLTSTGYTIDFSEGVNVTSGALSGNFTSLEQTDLSNGVRASLFTQGWAEGDGSGNISEFEVSVAPEPPVVYLLGLGSLALAFVAFRRTASRA